MTSFEFVEWTVSFTGGQIKLTTVYRCPYSAAHPVNTNTFFEEFENYLDVVLDCSLPVVVCGDFNIHVNVQEDLPSARFNDICSSRNLTQHVCVPTHVSGNTLDLIITRNDNMLHLTPPVEGHFISDHCFVTTALSSSIRHIETKTITFRSYRKIAIEAFMNDIHSSQLLNTDLLVSDDLDRLVGMYNSVLSELLDKHAPLKSKEITIRPKLPWITDEIVRLRQLRRRAERLWRRYGTMSSRNTFQYFRTRTTNLLFKACRGYYFSKIENCQGDQKKLYSIVNSLLMPDKTDEYPTYSSKTDLANKFNDYFIDKVTKIRNDLDTQSPVDNVLHTTVGVNQTLDCFTAVNMEVVKRYILKAPLKQCINDPIPTWLLKECIDVLLPIITSMVNCSFRNGVFATAWKNAVVVPLIKKPGAGVELSNYRPISNLCFISKLVERIAADQITFHMHKNDLFPVYQSAYRQFHSTETMLCRITSDIFQCMGNQQVVMMVLLDLSAVFDTVDHNLLLQIMQTDFGFDNPALSWLCSYLNNRHQRVSVSGKLSECISVRFGVPQGSCLGPMLFTAYASSLFNVISNYMMSGYGYADDTQLLKFFSPKVSDPNESLKNVEDCLASVQAWMLKHKLKLNDGKTEVILFGSRQQLETINMHHVKVGSNEINIVDNVRSLGFWLDSRLSMETHVNHICKRVNYSLHNLHQIRKYLTQGATECLVHSLITSHLDYVNSVMYGMPQFLFDKLQRLQNNAARLVLGLCKYDRI